MPRVHSRETDQFDRLAPVIIVVPVTGKHSNMVPDAARITANCVETPYLIAFSPLKSEGIKGKSRGMKKSKRKFKDLSPVEFLLFRDKAGFKRYIKQSKRDDEERQILIELGLKKIRERDKTEFIPIGYRKRKFII